MTLKCKQWVIKFVDVIFDVFFYLYFTMEEMYTAKPIKLLDLL